MGKGIFDFATFSVLPHTRIHSHITNTFAAAYTYYFQATSTCMVLISSQGPIRTNINNEASGRAYGIQPRHPQPPYSPPGARIKVTVLHPSTRDSMGGSSSTPTQKLADINAQTKTDIDQGFHFMSGAGAASIAIMVILTAAILVGAYFILRMCSGKAACHSRTSRNRRSRRSRRRSTSYSRDSSPSPCRTCRNPSTAPSNTNTIVPPPPTIPIPLPPPANYLNTPNPYNHPLYPTLPTHTPPNPLDILTRLRPLINDRNTARNDLYDYLDMTRPPRRDDRFVDLPPNDPKTPPTRQSRTPNRHGNSQVMTQI